MNSAAICMWIDEFSCNIAKKVHRLWWDLYGSTGEYKKLLSCNIIILCFLKGIQVHHLAHSSYSDDDLIRSYTNLHQYIALFLHVGTFSGETKVVCSENMIEWTNNPATTNQAFLWSHLSGSQCQRRGRVNDCCLKNQCNFQQPNRAVKMIGHSLQFMDVKEQNHARCANTKTNSVSENYTQCIQS